MSYERERLMPMFRGSASKIIFANLPSRSSKWFVDKFSHDIEESGLGSDWETVKTNLRQIRKAEVLVARGEVDSSRVGISAAVFGPKKDVLGSVSLVIVKSQATPEAIYSVSALVEAAARQIHGGLVNATARSGIDAAGIFLDHSTSADADSALSSSAS